MIDTLMVEVAAPAVAEQLGHQPDRSLPRWGAVAARPASGDEFGGLAGSQ
jgi:hypothetical protein